MGQILTFGEKSKIWFVGKDSDRFQKPNREIEIWYNDRKDVNKMAFRKCNIYGSGRFKKLYLCVALCSPFPSLSSPFTEE